MSPSNTPTPLLFGLCLLLGLSVCFPLAQAANTQSPPTSPIANPPFLRLETGMHTAMIRRIAVDAAERYLVTASDDKTARVWDLASGELLQILRPPIGAGDEGKLYAVALSPDGNEVAVGGYTGQDNPIDMHIYFFDRATARLSRQITGLPSSVNHLAYSRDGNTIAAALGGANGIRVYDTARLQQKPCTEDAYQDDSYWLDFDALGRLVSSSLDGFISLYDAQCRLLQKQTAPGGKQPYAVRFAPDGQSIAVGFNDSTAANVLSAKDLKLAYAPDTRTVDNGDVSTVAWSADGQTLYAGGSYDDEASMNLLLSWPQAGRGAPSRVALTATTIMDIQPLRGQRLAYGAGDPVWGVVESGQKRITQTALITDYRSDDRAARLQLNPAASVIGFVPYQQAQPKVFDVQQQAFITDTAALAPAQTTAKGYAITDWQTNLAPKFNYQPIQLKPNEISRSLAISHDDRHFLLGADWTLRYFDQQGHELWQTAIPSVAWAVNLSADGRFAVAAFADGTIRWYRTQDGKEQLAFFPLADGQRWVLWMPEGFYSASSPEAEALIGYHLNQGDGKEGQFIAATQLGKRFFRPDLIAQRLMGNEATIQTALQDLGDVRQVLAQGLPPSIELLSQATSSQTESRYVLRFKVKDEGGGIGDLVFKVNGVALDGRPIDVGIPGHDPISREFQLVEGYNTVEITAFNANNIESRPVKVSVKVKQVKQPVTLHVLALGISKYREHTLQLKYADKDALAIAEELKQRGRDLFDAVQTAPLVNQQVTLKNIDATVEALGKKIQPQDVFVLFLAGHGKNINGKYHFAPWETQIVDSNSLSAYSLDQNHLEKLLKTIPALKKVAILDTCDAGSFTLSGRDTDKIVRGLEQHWAQVTANENLRRATGTAIFSAASDENMALEGYGQGEEKHGVYTYAWLEGLKNADYNGNSQIELDELAIYLQKRVPEITQEKWGYTQTPKRDLQDMSFAIGKKP